MRRVDQRQVGERLREVAELAPGHRVVLLGQQPHVVAQTQQPLEQLAGLVAPARSSPARRPARTSRPGRRPRRAGRPSTRRPRRAVAAARSRRPSAPAGSPRRSPTHRAGRPPAGTRRAASAAAMASSSLGAVGLGERLLPLASKPSRSTSRVDLVAQRPPALDRPVEARSRSTTAHRPVERHPAMTLEWVKCAGRPRTSQMPASASRQPSSSQRNSVRSSDQVAGSEAVPLATVWKAAPFQLCAQGIQHADIERDEHQALAHFIGPLRREHELAALPVDLRDPRFPLLLISPRLREPELLHVKIDGPVDVRYEQHRPRIPFIAHTFCFPQRRDRLRRSATGES